MFEAIKSLSVKQRLFAFIFTVIVSSVVSVLTVYLKTDDCKKISDQYKSLIKNQEELMEINGNLLTKYNKAREDLLTVQTYIESVSNIQRQVKTRTSRSDIAFEQFDMITSDPSVNSDSSVSAILTEPRRLRINNQTTIIKEIPNEMIIAIDSIQKITSQYK